VEVAGFHARAVRTQMKTEGEDMILSNRRRHERFSLSPMYTEVKVVSLEKPAPTLLGHAYDVSEGGVRFELDYALKPGTPVAMELTFPAGELDDEDARRPVVVVGNVVWMDDHEPGPVRMALAVTRFSRESDRERLLHHLSHSSLRRAA
jgi:ribosomal protein L34